MNKLLKFLLPPFLFGLGVTGDEGGGGAAEDRGDTLDAGAPEVDATAQEDVDKFVEGEEEDEGEDEENEPAPVADDKGKKKDTRIPLNRHKELLEKERGQRAAVEAELAKYKQGQQVAKTNEAIEATEVKIVEMETEYNRLLADGELEKATALMSQIRRAERSIGDQKREFDVQAVEARAVERVRYDTVVERLEAAYPELNPDDEAFDKEAVEDVLDLKDTYERKGMSPSAALQKAVAKTFGVATAKQTTATAVTPNASKEAVAAARKEAATRTGLDAAKRTPANTSKVGTDNDKGGIGLTAKAAMGMSQAEFAKIDESELAKLRGDVLA